jgi:hypothetical protein
MKWKFTIAAAGTATIGLMKFVNNQISTAYCRSRGFHPICSEDTWILEKSVPPLELMAIRGVMALIEENEPFYSWSGNILIDSIIEAITYENVCEPALEFLPVKNIVSTLCVAYMLDKCFLNSRISRYLQGEQENIPPAGHVAEPVAVEVVRPEDALLNEVFDYGSNLIHQYLQGEQENIPPAGHVAEPTE